MSLPVLLITGAGGEIGHGLIDFLLDAGTHDLVTLDLKGLPEDVAARCKESVTGDILDRKLVESLFQRHEVDGVIHLAAMLSSSGERNPSMAFEVNVNGTMNIMECARRSAASLGRNVKFIFPSTIAVYGLPDQRTKLKAGAVREDDYLKPITMYGVNKLSCEHLGRYLSENYGALIEDKSPFGLDFRALRFPGLISSETVPSGGTSDYIPEMLHAVASTNHYTCFARADTQIPFMTMPDAVASIIGLYMAEESQLSQRVYNVGAFAPSAEEVAEILREKFPGATVEYEVDERRQRFLDTWPADVDDRAARTDWGYAPKHTLGPAFHDFLLPELTRSQAAG